MRFPTLNHDRRPAQRPMDRDAGLEHEHSPDDTWRLVSFIRAVPHLRRDDLESAGPGGAGEAAAHHHHEHER